MKGIVFTEFLNMVEEEFGLAVIDEMIEKAELPSGGSYTTVGTYDFFEMQQLLHELNRISGIPVQELIYQYGLYFFNCLTRQHPNIFNYYQSAMAFVAGVENHIHVEVRKLYPKAELPSFKVIEQSDDCLQLIYTSERAMYMFAQALMEKTFAFYRQKVYIYRELLNPKGTRVQFTIKSHAKPHQS